MAKGDIQLPKNPLNGLKAVVETIDAATVSEFHQLAIDAAQEGYRLLHEQGPTPYNQDRYWQLLDLESAIIARGRVLGVYPPEPPPKKRG